MKTKILSALFIFITFFTFGQQFENSISNSKFSIEEESFPAFKTYFDYKPSSVEKGWWKYSRQFGKPLNMRKYYQVTIPREVEGTELEFVLYSKPVPSENGASFTLAIDNKALPSEKQEAYLSQLKLILMEFKRYFYLEKYEEQLEEVTKLAEKNGSLASKLEGAPREEVLGELQVLTREVDRIKMKIVALQK
ncbi:MAG: hypothetical protein RIA69_01470 [Cyclobacteriaceae bacterium]